MRRSYLHWNYAASGWILGEWEGGNSVQLPVVPKNFNRIVTLLALDMDAYTEKFGDKAVRKNLTIPAYLNTYAEAHGINFYAVLQAALQDQDPDAEKHDAISLEAFAKELKVNQ